MAEVTRYRQTPSAERDEPVTETAAWGLRGAFKTGIGKLFPSGIREEILRLPPRQLREFRVSVFSSMT